MHNITRQVQLKRVLSFLIGFESASLQYKAKRKSEQIIVNCSILKFKLAKVAAVPTIN